MSVQTLQANGEPIAKAWVTAGRYPAGPVVPARGSGKVPVATRCARRAPATPTAKTALVPWEGSVSRGVASGFSPPSQTGRANGRPTGVATRITAMSPIRTDARTSHRRRQADARRRRPLREYGVPTGPKAGGGGDAPSPHTRAHSDACPGPVKSTSPDA